MYAITLDIKGTMRFASTTFTQRTEFTTMDATAPTPEKPLQRQDLSSTYYYVYKYIDMLNKNLETAMLNLAAEFTDGQDRTHIQTYATPCFEIDPETCKIVFNVDKYVRSSESAEHLFLWRDIFQHSTV